ncbi:MAG TPA: hypothetical protein VIG89_00920 [Candidatus Acidoferrales bacterium]
MNRLLQVTSKLKRTKKHIADLEIEIRRFLDTNPYKVGTKRDPESRKLIYYVSSVQPTPDCLPLITGDAIQNMMSALDHLAYQLVFLDTNDRPPNPKWIYFPIQDTADKYEAQNRGKMEGALQDTFDAIDAIKPYKGGNDLLWALFGLNNIEKHRLLFTVGSMFQSLDVGAHMTMMMNQTISSQPDHPWHGKALPDIAIFLRPQDGLFPLKVGDELFTGALDEEPNPKMQFRFNVALSEPEIIEAQSLLEMVHQMSNLVEGIVSSFAARLK